jgi:parvulin-like peptidyl-prolyl isomerase
VEHHAPYYVGGKFMNLIKKIIALVMVLSIPFSLAACSGDTSWSFKVDGTNVQAGVYILYLLDARKQVTSKNTDTTKDPWIQQIESKDAVTWATDYATNNCRKAVAIERDFKNRKLTITAQDQTNIDDTVNKAESSNGKDYTDAGISLESLTRYYTVNTMEFKLFNAIYGPGGEKAVSDADLKKEFQDKYVRVKHILIPTIDLTTRSPLTADQIKAAETSANDVLVKAKAAKTDAAFMALVTTYNKDPGMNADPATAQAGSPNKEEGYIIPKTNSGMIPEYETAAASLKVGDVTLVKSTTYGFFIMKGYNLLENNDKYFTEKKSSILQGMKSAEFLKMYDDKGNALKSKTITNKATIDLFKVKGLTDITASSQA